MAEQVRITYVRSSIGRTLKHKKTIKALGFTKLNQSRIVNWNPSIAGMVNKVSYLLKLEPVGGKEEAVTSEHVENHDTEQKPSETEKENDA